MQLSNRSKWIPESGIRKIFSQAQKLKNPLDLSLGQPDFDVPDPLKKEAAQSIQKGKNGYTPSGGLPILKEKLLKQVQDQKKRKFEDILITSGVSGALFLTLLALVNEGDEVLIPDPYFVSYKHLTRLVGGIPKFIETYPHFRLTKQVLEKAIQKNSRVILLNSPANPTGKVYSKEELDEITEILIEREVFVVTDEIYDSFVYTNTFVSPASYQDLPLVLLSGFSKSLAMTGWRVGYAAGPKALIEKMTEIQQYTFVCAPSPAQWSLVPHLDFIPKKEIYAYQKKRDYVMDHLQFELEKPEGAFYAFPKVPVGKRYPWKNDLEFVAKALEKEVLIVPGSTFSETHRHFRLSFAVADSVLKEGIERLNSLVA